MPFLISGSQIQETCRIKLTSSKSISNRLLMIQALSKEPVTLHNLATADDTVLLNSLLKGDQKELDARDAGTVFRFLVAYLAIQPGIHVLKGSKRMNERPVGPLVNALNQLGANITFLGVPGFPPLQIEGKNIAGGIVSIDAGISSQFISALLMIAPLLEEGLQIRLEGEIVSMPYIQMTLDLMSSLGVQAQRKGNEIHVPHQSYQGKEMIVETDWSSASFWYLISALSPGRVFFLEGLQADTLQGDSQVSEWMKSLGVETVFEKDGAKIVSQGFSSWSQTAPFHFDFKNCPDLFPPMLVACAALSAEARFSSLTNLKHKESDRLSVLLGELGKCGLKYQLNDAEDEMLLPNQKLSPPDRTFHTHQDHRIAMALAPLAQIFGTVKLDDISVVQKSYPEFWNQLSSSGFSVQKIS